MPSPASDAAARRRRPAPGAPLLALLTTLLATLGALAGATLVAAPAGAHDTLVASDPADGAVLDAPPAAVTLEFNDEVIPTGTQVVVTDASGARVDAGTPQAAGAVVTAALPADLAAGAYTVAWRVVSSDGHPIEGTLGFTLRAAAAPSASPAAPSAPATDAPVPSGATGATTTPAPAADGHAGHRGPGTGPWVVLGLLTLLVAAGTAAVTAARRRAAITQAARRDDDATGR